MEVVREWRSKIPVKPNRFSNGGAGRGKSSCTEIKDSQRHPYNLSHRQNFWKFSSELTRVTN